MNVCQLCPQPNYKSSVSLIKDSCEHSKYHLCLLQEENGYSICDENNFEVTPQKVKFIGHFSDYPQINKTTPNYETLISIPYNEILKYSENGNCISLQNKLITNEDNLYDRHKNQDKEIESQDYKSTNNCNDCDPPNENESIINDNNDDDHSQPNKNLNNKPQRIHDTQLSNALIRNINENENFNEESYCSTLKKNCELNKDAVNTIKEIHINHIDSNQLCKKLNVTKSLTNIECIDNSLIEKKINSNNVDNITELDKECQSKNIYNKQSSIQTFLITINKVTNNIDSPSFQLLLVTNNDNKVSNNTENKQNEIIYPLQLNKKLIQYLSCKSSGYSLSDCIILKKQDDANNTNELSNSLTESVIENDTNELSNSLTESVIENDTNELSSSLTESVIENDTNELSNSLTESVTYEIPEFRSADSLIFNNPLVICEQSQNQNNTINLSDCDQSIIIPIECAINKRIDNLENSHKNIAEEESKIKRDSLNKNNQNKQTDCREKSSDLIKKLSDNFKNTNCPLVKKKIISQEEIINKEEQKRKSKKVDDENKEIKEKLNENENKEKNIKPFKLETKHKNEIYKDKIEINADNKTNNKKTEDKNIKNNKQLRSSARSKKFQNSTKNNQISVKKKESKPRKDWSHIIVSLDNPTTYTCTFCKKVFKTLRSKTYHSKCSLGKTPFECDICNRTFTTRSHFEYHTRTHTGHKPYKCDLCDKSFIQQHKLNRHQAIHKQQNKLECNECGKTFNTKQYLKNHWNINHQKHEFQCKVCSKTFTLNYNRRRHERSHSSNRPFKCDVCSTSFKHKFLLTRHKLIHEKNKPFSCDICNRVFLSKFEVQRHITSHSDTKPFSCKLCKVRFRRRDNLNRHVKHHHTEGMCGKIVEGEITEQQPLDIGTTSIKKTENRTESSISQVVENEKKILNSKPKFRSKRRLKSNSTSTSEYSSISSKSKNVKGGPISIQLITETRCTSETSGLTAPIPREEVLDLNRQIEEKIYTQTAFCNFPGLTRSGTGPNGKRRNSHDNNSKKNDGANEQNHKKIKTKKSNKEQEKDVQKNDDPKKIKDINVHWRRRTAESLKLKLGKNI